MNGEEMEGNGPEEMKTKQTSKQLSFGGAGSFEILKVIWLEGEFSRPKSFDELPANHLGPLSTET